MIRQTPTGAYALIGLPVTSEEASELEEITAAVYSGGKHRLPEADVRWLVALLGRMHYRLIPDCKCPCHGSDDHCSDCCQGPLCDDCRFYSMSDG
jgi:hypothetical protein